MLTLSLTGRVKGTGSHQRGFVASPFTLTPSTPYPSLLATTTNTSSPQPLPTSRFDTVGLTPSQHHCLNTEDHNHHQRVKKTRWWALLSLNLEHQPPPPPTSHFDSLVGLSVSLPPNTPASTAQATTTTNPLPTANAGIHHHQQVVLTRWWALLPLNLECQPPPPPTSHFDSLVGLTPSQPASTTKNESF